MVERREEMMSDMVVFFFSLAGVEKGLRCVVWG